MAIKTLESFRASKATARRNNVTVHMCPFRGDGVECIGESKCQVCGWHPAVEAKRKAEIREKLGLKPKEATK